MTEKRFTLHIDWFNYDKTDGEATLSENGQPLLESECVEDMRRLKDLLNELNDENEQLKQFPVKLDNRIQKLEESLKALKEMETDDLNPQAVEDVATVIGMSLNALMEFRRELKGDVE